MTRTGNAQNLMITETAVLNTKVINETRFQWTRNWSNSMGNLIPADQRRRGLHRPAATASATRTT